MCGRASILVALLVSVPTLASAQDTPPMRPVAAALEVRSADACLATDLAPEVTRWLHRDEVDASLSAVLTTPADGVGTLLEIVHDGVVVAERLFEGNDATCPERRAALGLMVALALETAELEVAETELAEVVVEPPAPEVPVVPPASPWRGGIEIAANGSLGLLPAPAGGAALVGEVGFDLVTLRFGALGAFTADVALNGGSISTALAAGRIDLCLGGRWDALGLEGCVGVGAGALDARGHGYADDRDAWIPWVSALGGLAGRWFLDASFALRLAIEAFVPLARPQIAIVDGADTTVASIDLPPVGGMLSLGACFVFR